MSSLTGSVLTQTMPIAKALTSKHSRPRLLWFPLNRVWIYETWCHLQVGTRRRALDRRWGGSKFRVSRWVCEDQVGGRRRQCSPSRQWVGTLHMCHRALLCTSLSPCRALLRNSHLLWLLCLQLKVKCFQLVWAAVFLPICHILGSVLLFGFLPLTCLFSCLPSPSGQRHLCLYVSTFLSFSSFWMCSMPWAIRCESPLCSILWQGMGSAFLPNMVFWSSFWIRFCCACSID